MKSLIKIIIAFICPPVTAGLQVGLSFHFWLNIVLWILGIIPGVIHAIWLVLVDKERPEGA